MKAISATQVLTKMKNQIEDIIASLDPTSDISEDTFESICCAAYEIYILHTIGIDEEYNTTTEDVTEMRLTVDNEVII